MSKHLGPGPMASESRLFEVFAPVALEPTSIMGRPIVHLRQYDVKGPTLCGMAIGDSAVAPTDASDMILCNVCQDEMGPDDIFSSEELMMAVRPYNMHRFQDWRPKAGGKAVK